MFLCFCLLVFCIRLEYKKYSKLLSIVFFVEKSPFSFKIDLFKLDPRRNQQKLLEVNPRRADRILASYSMIGDAVDAHLS